eukprot:3767006-Rhodomonas_salina.1
MRPGRNCRSKCREFQQNRALSGEVVRCVVLKSRVFVVPGVQSEAVERGHGVACELYLPTRCYGMSGTDIAHGLYLSTRVVRGARY